MQGHIPSKRRSGFTLIELMVVLVLISVLTAIIIPEMRGTFSDSVLRASSRDLVQVMHLASSRSVTANQAHRLTFDMGKGTYLLEKQTGKVKGQAKFEPLADAPGGKGKLGRQLRLEVKKESEEETLVDTSSNFYSGGEDGNKMNSRTLTFYPDGTAEKGEIVLEDREGFRVALRINPTTTRVEIVDLPRK